MYRLQSQSPGHKHRGPDSPDTASRESLTEKQMVIMNGGFIGGR